MLALLAWRPRPHHLNIALLRVYRRRHERSEFNVYMKVLHS